MFRNLIHCGGVETEESVLVKLRRKDDKPEICGGGEGELGGSSWVVGNPLNQQELDQKHKHNHNHNAGYV